ncbi:MAG: magnesium/cobalt transporter CorA [Bacteroidia bacterium]|nr:magnesium/cobalt transporter CorA [Bacteroidia bacterium]MBT8287597.1 magnesium/cobalt transporter CorA [Bacteroidia bacterium]NNK69818.1 magnesium/cobalt transporter CorA [Flavobacteriaceae bacterium]NNL79677.1 magnesium/cobalt transporter CorA [Flavobacteriaceae bacterium]
MTKKNQSRSRNKKKKPSHKHKVGQVPGSIIYTGNKDKKGLIIELFDYTADTINHRHISTVEEAFNLKKTESNSWLNINGLNHVHSIESIGKHYDLHPLVLEDIVNINQRPKLDDYEDYLFVTLRMMYYENSDILVSEQVSLILGSNYLISFQEAEGDVFDEVRQRLVNSKGRVRFMHADYLLYALIDSIVDHYFMVIETLGDKIEDLENQLFEGLNQQTIVHEIQSLKREILRVRRSVFPVRELINKIEKYENHLITENSKIYYRDVYDHIIQVSEHIEIYREMISGLMEMHMNAMSNRMNEVMKVLTVMASIFIPLTFIAGIYGMNFENIPELKFQYGYYVLWGFMVVIVIFMVLYFKRKKWL